MRDLLLDRLETLVDVITAETGKLGAEAVFTEVMTACETIQYYAKHGERALRPRKVSPGLMSHKQAVRSYEPLGVVGVISPWNYPFILAMTPIITALFAGNSVVLKPSEVTPLVGRVIGDLFADVGGAPGPRAGRHRRRGHGRGARAGRRATRSASRARCAPASG